MSSMFHLIFIFSSLTFINVSSLSFDYLSSLTGGLTGGLTGLVGGGDDSSDLCPPKGFDSQRNFNLDDYLGTWYAQEQMAVVYLPTNNNFCVRAQYSRDAGDESDIRVINYANRGEVNGEVTGGPLRAVLPDDKEMSKLAVGPRFIPSMFYGPYWVVAAGRNADPNEREPTTGRYEWALISGGPPTIESSDEEERFKGCRTGRGVNNSGLWIFSRMPVARDSQILFVKDIARQMGFDVSVLNPIMQKGCLYNEE